MSGRLFRDNERKLTLFNTVFIVLLLFYTISSHAAVRYSFNIPAMNAAAALNKVADISGYSLLYPFDDSIIVMTNPLHGKYPLSEALSILLLDTHLNAITTDKRVIAVSSVLGNYKNPEYFAMDMQIKNQLKQQMKTIKHKSIIAVSPFSLPYSSYAPDGDSQTSNNEQALERIQIIGSRRFNRSPLETLAPIEVINNQVIRRQGKPDILSILSDVVPSYNVTQEAISDAGTIVRPANLRGLPTDSALILVNGKRRHRSGVIYEYISGVNIGAHGVDLDSIPSIALKSIEVLKDGAAAQYGSDAIAGVVNFRLENSTEADIIELRTGEYGQGDGRQIAISGIWGTSIAEAGSANFSFELSENKPTSRGIQDPAVEQLISAGVNNEDIQKPVVHWGAPQITENIKLLANIELDLGKNGGYRDFYLFGNWSQREVNGSFFYRNPNTRASVYTNPNNGTRLFFDMTSDGTGNCPKATLPGDSNDAEALANVFANDDCFAFNERFPGGFTPRFGGKVLDTSLTTGLRGLLKRDFAEVSYDVSLLTGKNKVTYHLWNSVNASLGEHSPSDFELGAQIQTEHLFNMDFSFPVDVGFESELNVAFGYQHHFEQFEIIAGEEASYQTGPFTDNGEAIGANGFPGFSPKTAGTNSRTSDAFYLDIESDISDALSMSLAMRYENIGKIGNTFDGKLSVRLQASEQIALRSTLSSGFRAPTVAQSTMQRISTTNSVINGAVVQQTSQLVSALSPIAISRSGGGLEPEKAMNFSFGILSEINTANITVDYFHIDITDRLSLFSSEIMASDSHLLTVSGVTPQASNIQYYANDFDSVTQGVDVVATLPFHFQSKVDGMLSLAFNYTDTKLHVTNDISPIANDNVRKEREKGIPNTRTVLTYYHWQGDISAMLRVNYYGSFYNAQFNDVSLLDKFDARAITDIELSYNFTQDVVFTLGAQNVFDIYPEEFNKGREAGFLGAIYPTNSPYGFNGSYYYMKVNWSF